MLAAAGNDGPLRAAVPRAFPPSKELFSALLIWSQLQRAATNITPPDQFVRSELQKIVPFADAQRARQEQQAISSGESPRKKSKREMTNVGSGSSATRQAEDQTSSHGESDPQQKAIEDATENLIGVALAASWGDAPFNQVLACLKGSGYAVRL
jgi:hypothetical protein